MSAIPIRERREDRVDLLVRVTLHTDGASSVVRLCNISARGALVEGEDLPATGRTVDLQRGATAVQGRIIWRAGNKAGISFSDRTEVEHWFPEAEPQNSVDKAFQRIARELNRQDKREPVVAPHHRSQITADDMERSAGALEELADALAGEPDLFGRYATQLQALDISAQLLRKLALRED